MCSIGLSKSSFSLFELSVEYLIAYWSPESNYIKYRVVHKRIDLGLHGFSFKLVAQQRFEVSRNNARNANET